MGVSGLLPFGSLTQPFGFGDRGSSRAEGAGWQRGRRLSAGPPAMLPTSWLALPLATPWLQVYYVYGFFLLVFLILLIVTVRGGSGAASCIGLPAAAGRPPLRA